MTNPKIEKLVIKYKDRNKGKILKYIAGEHDNNIQPKIVDCLMRGDKTIFQIQIEVKT